MKRICLYILLFSCSIANAQNFPSAAASAGSESRISGAVVMPPLQTLTVTTNGSPNISFNSNSDLGNGRELPAFYHLEVKSTVPWVITVRSESENFTSSGTGADNIPANVVSVKSSAGKDFMPVSAAEKTLLTNANDNIVNRFDIDVKINPAWKYSGGIYNLNLVFTLSPQ